MTALWRRVRGLLCGLLGHRYIGDPHHRLCVYCWKEVKLRTFPPPGDDSDDLDGPETGPRP